MMDALEEILESRRADVARAKQERSAASLANDLKHTPPPRDFFASLNQPGRISVIAEMKKRSPSAGLIRENYNVAEIASAYERGGARALSVLTEPQKFGGSVSDLHIARKAAGVPILRKDFIFDAYQILEARVAGADAVLLIADMLEKNQLMELVEVSLELKVEPLVEIFTEGAVEGTLAVRVRLIGINTRNLRTLEMSPDNVARLGRLLPKEKLVVAESGIRRPEDIQALKNLNIGAVLVGESLLRQADPEKAVRELVSAGEKT